MVCLFYHCVGNRNDNVTLSPLSCFACQFYFSQNFAFDYSVRLTVQTQCHAHFVRNEAGRGKWLSDACMLFPVMCPKGHFLLRNDDIGNKL